MTDHDVAAFVDVLAASAGEAGRWIHFGLTSSDVLDTALALQLRAAGEVIVAGARSLRSRAHRARARARGDAVRRAHPRRARRADELRDQARRVRVRGRTATRRAWSARSRRSPSAPSPVRSAPTPPPAPSSRRACSAVSGSPREDVSTQVVPRDRHAELLSAIALAGAGLERFATEVRHLQRTEVREVQEPFRAGQKGSSAMPHKRNPIKSEQISGLARVLRGNAQAALENVALWHERDISHSSVERVILPDSTILIDYLQHRAIALVENMTVDAERMRANLELTHGALFSQRVLLALVEAGSRAIEAYRIVQELAQRAWDEGIPLRELLAADERARRASTSTRYSTTRTTSATSRRSSRGSIGSASDPPSSDRRALVASRRVTTLADLPLIASGKVREMYDLEGVEGVRELPPPLLMVASDRISTYDAVHPTPIPDKGKVLTGLSVFWFAADRRDRRQPLPVRHRRRARAGARAGARRAAACRCCPVECVVRGYITGSGLEGLPGQRLGVRDRAAARACASPSSCPSRSSRPAPRPTWATTRRSTSTARSSSSAIAR